MSRTDPQFNLRIPEMLRDKVVAAAKETGRSSTAEILARLELSFISETQGDELVAAGRAKELSRIARQSIPSIVKKRIISSISRAVAMGHSTAEIDLKDLELEALPSSHIDDLLDSFSKMLTEHGYSYEWDGPNSVWIRFDDL